MTMTPAIQAATDIGNLSTTVYAARSVSDAAAGRPRDRLYVVHVKDGVKKSKPKARAQKKRSGIKTSRSRDGSLRRTRKGL